MPDGTAKSPNQPNNSAKNRQRDKYFPEARNDPDYNDDGNYIQATFIAAAITGMTATAAAMFAMNRDVFPWSCMNMPYAHNCPPKQLVRKNGGADGDRTRKQ